jgi:hypothetical protein
MWTRRFFSDASKHVDNLERTASRRRPAFSSHLIQQLPHCALRFQNRAAMVHDSGQVCLFHSAMECFLQELNPERVGPLVGLCIVESLMSL